MTPEDFVKGLCCQLAWRDGQAGGFNLCAAILFILNSRTKNPQLGFSTDYQDNVAVLAGDNPMPFPDIREPIFQKLLSAVDTVFDGTAVDRLTQGGLHYADLTRPELYPDLDKLLGDPDRYPRIVYIPPMTIFGQTH